MHHFLLSLSFTIVVWEQYSKQEWADHDAKTDKEWSSHIPVPLTFLALILACNSCGYNRIKWATHFWKAYAYTENHLDK